MGERTAVGQESHAELLEAVEISNPIGNDFLALDAVSFSVRLGEIYCLLGAAGAGETLLLHTFLGFVKPTAGRAVVWGIDAARDPVAAHPNVLRSAILNVMVGLAMVEFSVPGTRG